MHFGVIFLIAFLIAGCVSRKEFQALETKNQELMEELNSSKTLAENRKQTLQELLIMLESIQSKGVEKGFLMEDMSEKLNQMKTNSEMQESQISDLSKKVSDFEKRAARDKQIHDQLVKGLKTMIDSGQAEIIRLSGKTRIRLAEAVLFKSGEAVLLKSGESALQKIGGQLKQFKDRRIMIEGHTDSIPIGKNLKSVFPSNLELSAARAVAVHQFLRNELKMSEKSLAVVAFGPYLPIDSNETEKGRKRNRRVVLVLEPIMTE